MAHSGWDETNNTRALHQDQSRKMQPGSDGIGGLWAYKSYNGRLSKILCATFVGNVIYFWHGTYTLINKIWTRFSKFASYTRWLRFLTSKVDGLVFFFHCCSFALRSNLIRLKKIQVLYGKQKVWRNTENFYPLRVTQSADQSACFS